MFDKVKQHIKDHQDAYVIGGAVVIAGITYPLMRGTVLQRGAGVGILHSGVTNTASFNFRNQQIINLITVIVPNGRGHPGFPVMCLETGEKWLTQGAAARAVGVTESLMSTHLAGKIPDILGKHFVRISLTPI